ncbi:hypothetical protein Mal15_26070 [Stieleria maiorica]|uniref:Uncharacterized protein n=1 Tax=Stieleria maiorica TaxID=2795974 RepID=A0A5B9MG33_9BACT|nr:hypothetical protein [Stieleria maiorica]QEF98555.1 hypothetical protein Mal15_26070 [Stieleria maiorica]
MKMYAFLVFLPALLLAAGCQSSTEPETPATSAEAAQDHSDDEDQRDHSVKGHGHGIGPHDGTVADWGGGKYHPEFTVNHDNQEATVYILGPDEKTPVPIEAESIELSISNPEMQLTLNASPQEGDPEGMASRFVGNHEKLGVVQEYAGTVSGVIEETPYAGDFNEGDHEGHAH